MLQKIIRMFRKKKRLYSEARSFHAEQATLAREVCDIVSLARKMDFPVRVTIMVNGIERGFFVRGHKDVFLEGLYNYCAGTALEYDTWDREMRQNKGGGHKEGVDRSENTGREIAPEGP